MEREAAMVVFVFARVKDSVAAVKMETSWDAGPAERVGLVVLLVRSLLMASTPERLEGMSFGFWEDVLSAGPLSVGCCDCDCDCGGWPALVLPPPLRGFDMASAALVLLGIALGSWDEVFRAGPLSVDVAAVGGWGEALNVERNLERPFMFGRSHW